MKELAEGLNDPFHTLRLFTLNRLDQSKVTDPAILTKIEMIADRDADKLVRAKALEILSKQKDKKYIPLFTRYVTDSSYSVAGAALQGLSLLDPANAYSLAKKYSVDAKGKLGNVISSAIMNSGTDADFDFISNQYSSSPPNQEKLQTSADFAVYLIKVKDPDKVKKGLAMIMAFRKLIPEQYRGFTDPPFKEAFSKLAAAKKDQGDNQLADYINGLIK